LLAERCFVRRLVERRTVGWPGCGLGGMRPSTAADPRPTSAWSLAGEQHATRVCVRVLPAKVEAVMAALHSRRLSLFRLTLRAPRTTTLEFCPASPCFLLLLRQRGQIARARTPHRRQPSTHPRLRGGEMSAPSAPEVTLHTSVGPITVELYYKHAPKTCQVPSTFDPETLLPP